MEQIESIHDWIAKQDWSDAKKWDAVMWHNFRIDKGWNPLTLGQWETWSNEYDSVRSANQ